MAKTLGGVPFIDWLRAIAPAIVMWAHLGPMTLWLFGNPWLPWAWSQSSFDTLHIMEGGGHLGVLLFFLVSGFIISYVADQETRAEFATKRIFRIFPMLFCGVAIAFVLSRLIPGELFSFRDLVLSASLLDHLSTTQKLLTVTWSLIPEVGFYALMIAFFDHITRRPVNSTYVLIGGLFALKLCCVGSLATPCPPSISSNRPFLSWSGARPIWSGLVAHRERMALSWRASQYRRWPRAISLHRTADRSFSAPIRLLSPGLMLWRYSAQQ